MKKAVLCSICSSLALIAAAGASPGWSSEGDWSWTFEDGEYTEERLSGEELAMLDEMRRVSGELEAYESILIPGVLPEIYHGIVEIAIKEIDIRLGILQAEAMEDYDIADLFFRELDVLEVQAEDELIRLEELGAEEPGRPIDTMLLEGRLAQIEAELAVAGDGERQIQLQHELELVQLHLQLMEAEAADDYELAEELQQQIHMLDTEY